MVIPDTLKKVGEGARVVQTGGIPDKTDREMADTVIDLRGRVEKRHALERERVMEEKWFVLEYDRISAAAKE